MNLQNEFNKLVNLYRSGRHDQVIILGKKLGKKLDQDLGFNEIMGASYLALNQLSKAEKSFQKCIRADKKRAQSHYNLGIVLMQQNKVKPAIQSFKETIRLQANHVEAYNSLGFSLNQLQLFKDAADYLKKATTLNPNHFIAWNNLGVSFIELGQVSQATECFTRAINLNPNYGNALANLGNIYREKAPEKAQEFYTKAVSIDAHNVDALNGLGHLLLSAKEYQEAAKNFQSAATARPDFFPAHANLFFLNSLIADWKERSKAIAEIKKFRLEEQLAPPFQMISMEDNPRNHLKRAQAYSKPYERNNARSTKDDWSHLDLNPEKIKIAYVSADFKDHAVSHLITGVFEKHDKSKFEIHALALIDHPEDDYKKRIVQAVDHFLPIDHLSDEEVRAYCQENGIHIAVDLNGYTQNMRANLFGQRLAPIQINYLGYPNTMGADFMDYIIADKTVIPEGYEKFYSEKIIYMPHCYQPNDDNKIISDTPITRAQYGLPEDGFVFCCFNNNYKITSDEFEIWMRLLNKVPDSVLWLFKSHDLFEQNIRKHAHDYGVDPERIIFAGRVPLEDHLNRHRLADLFLDTFNYNAHTTASDALYTGLPLVTKMGEQFAARVAGSILMAADLDELVTSNAEDYEALALALAKDPGRLNAIRDKLGKTIKTSPLYATDQYRRDLEDLYRNVFQDFRS